MRERINTDEIKIDNPTDNTWEAVWYGDKPIEKNDINSTDCIITIGDIEYLNWIC